MDTKLSHPIEEIKFTLDAATVDALLKSIESRIRSIMPCKEKEHLRAAYYIIAAQAAAREVA